MNSQTEKQNTDGWQAKNLIEGNKAYAKYLRKRSFFNQLKRDYADKQRILGIREEQIELDWTATGFPALLAAEWDRLPYKPGVL
jgi:hypothetical protein